MRKFETINMIMRHIKMIDEDLEKTDYMERRSELHKAKSMALRSLVELMK